MIEDIFKPLPLDEEIKNDFKPLPIDGETKEDLLRGKTQEEIQKLFSGLNRPESFLPKKDLDAEPTKTPKSFQEQIQFYNGMMWAFMNGAWSQVGTTPKFKVGSGSKTSGASTGTEAITGIGFQPSAIIVFACSQQNTGSHFSVGFSDGSTDKCLRRYDNGGNELFILNGAIISVFDTGGDDTVATISSFDSDGFTLNWTSTDETVQYAYLCLA